MIALLVLLLLGAHRSFVSQFVAGEADDWKEKKQRLRCRRLFSDLPAWASEALVSILLALVTIDLAFLRGAFNFVGLFFHAWCSSRV